MYSNSCFWQISTFVTLIWCIDGVTNYKRNYDLRFTNSDIPEWKQRACEKAQKNKANSHYTCDDKGNLKCLPGWQGDLCQVPICRSGCDPMNGYCQRPNECRCRIGYTGDHCNNCIPLPGCQHGYCNKPFECVCKPGWDGLFCTEPTCRQGCHNTRGYCEAPGECRCRIGWAGRNCSDCSVLPGCQHGTCSKPLECQCLPGYTGLLCQTALCSMDCHKQHGYCRKPGECRCKVGWTGENCDKCFPYPGCINGDCQQPWECNCKPGWGGMLCDEKLTYCDENPNSCENGGKCISLTKADGSYHCHCRQGYLGKNCEVIDEFMLTSTAAPRITPPPLVFELKPTTTTSRIQIDRMDVVPAGTEIKKSVEKVKNKNQDEENKNDEDNGDDDEDTDDDDDDEEYDDDEDDDDEEDEEDVDEAQKTKNFNRTVTMKPVNIAVNVTKLVLQKPSNQTILKTLSNNNTTPTTTNTTTPSTGTKPTTFKLVEEVNSVPKAVSIGNSIDDDGFARRRNGGDTSFVFPTMSLQEHDTISFDTDIADFDTVANTAPDIVGTAMGQ